MELKEGVKTVLQSTDNTSLCPLNVERFPLVPFYSKRKRIVLSAYTYTHFTLDILDYSLQTMTLVFRTYLAEQFIHDVWNESCQI